MFAWIPDCLPSWLSRKRSPLAADVEWARHDAAEKAARAAHKAIRHHRAAKRARLERALRKPDATPISRAIILNVLGA